MHRSTASRGYTWKVNSPYPVTSPFVEFVHPQFLQLSMAQWSGQFTGRTHQSKVRDREVLLLHAIDMYRKTRIQPERDAQAKTVYRLADQLLKARVRAMKARLNALGPRPPDSPLVREIETKIQDMLDGGTRALLDEFNASEI